jgi:hypothetical protein
VDWALAGVANAAAMAAAMQPRFAVRKTICLLRMGVY